MKKNTRTIVAPALTLLAVWVSSGHPGEGDALMEADRLFAAETAARGGDGWADFFAGDGVMFPASGRVDGQEAIRARMLPAFDGSFALRWEPKEAVLAASGDLGYTIGRWESVVATSGADSTTGTGYYVTIWRKVPGEGWRVAVDIGNRDN